ncbi:hypothetical protein Poly51_39860 [Rubripirellula tenax]|uniref:Uncharacterized protein n=1 Tax=Rubripirellula tenax TaxID=2528015 RepID=A0A5C6ELT0_9BACT|nr:hypothetical protein [Rubripirellula tenax]TWU50693.1 hypothetical protein Poly51_39860 [Rubripirellula tenax]
MIDYSVIAQTQELAFENYQVLTLVSALAGAVRPNLRAVFVTCSSPDTVTVHFALSADTPEDREEIADIIFELEAGQLDPLNVTCNSEVHVHSDHIQLPSNLGRPVFIRNSPQFT